ncbi:acidic fibroblast growth factor binding protein [Gorgonomyces haynaldii]|nr:acidic fibroblast growth factor binding protein [Gorgonomyces haynaldii]
MNYTTVSSTKVTINRTLWNAWLSGLGTDNAVDYLLMHQKVQSREIPTKYHATLFVVSQYRQFEMLEQFLSFPKTLRSQLLFPLDKQEQEYLIESYYGYDEKVVRELLGKKLTQRVRKDLDDVALKSGVAIMGCRRIFDNIKRIIKRIEDIEGPLQELIARHFLISPELAQSYANIMFLNHHRLDTTKRRLSNYRFRDFEYAASVFSLYFTTSPSEPYEIDAILSHDARDLKTVLFNHKETIEPFRRIVNQYLEQQGHADISEKGGINAYRVLIKNILMLGIGLGNGKELRDIFSTIQEKIIDPAQSFGWTVEQFAVFMDALVRHFDSPNSGLNVNVQRRFANSFQRLVIGIKLVSCRLFQSPQ